MDWVVFVLFLLRELVRGVVGLFRFRDLGLFFFIVLPVVRNAACVTQWGMRRTMQRSVGNARVVSHESFYMLGSTPQMLD